MLVFVFSMGNRKITTKITVLHSHCSSAAFSPMQSTREPAAGMDEWKDYDSCSFTEWEKVSLKSERIERMPESIKTKVYTIDLERVLAMYRIPQNLEA